MAVEWIPPRRPEGLRALLSPTPAPAHDVGKFSLHSSILPVAPATARQRDKLPAPSKPPVHARMSAIRMLTQVRSGRQAGRQASRQAGRQQDLSSCSPLRLYRRAAGATNKGVLVARQSAWPGARHHTWSLPVQTRHSFDRRRRDDRPHDRPTSDPT